MIQPELAELLVLRIFAGPRQPNSHNGALENSESCKQALTAQTFCIHFELPST